MKQQEVFKKIGTIVKELNEQYEYLSTTTEPLNDLELELFVANTHFLSEHSEVLRKLNLQSPPPIQKTAVQPEEKYFEPVVQQGTPVNLEEKAPPIAAASEKPAEVTISSTSEYDSPAPSIDLGGHDEEDISYMRQQPEIIRHELILDESELWEDEDDQGFVSEELTDNEEELIETPFVKAPVKPAMQPIAATHVAEPKAADTVEEPLTINQKISATLHATGRGTEQIHAQPITDLKAAITLNDKLLYIKDLFNGYNLAYSEAMDILNRFTTFDEADKFLQTSYAIKNQWESKQATADRFYELLKRRYL
ncbi:MAG: hypothetical protein ABI203_03445 [Mucilaginibacter sp.]